ncbi:hypothetical protein FHS50_000228 [Sphingomicrobium lutaoense]|uniref:Uncharacterized protein n=2 Tax=Sphingomicrobium lutaoense TaxID=515949 RepID=A0A839Z0W3_9SPHN|nr:hypothetical protein [Sphingomicrobium lutaoense]MBB3763205.1 hypothetical protein [Sphingomicrobium lutaoense]
MAEDGAITVIDRTLLHDGENSAARVHCIATAANGARAYSLNSTTGGELKIKTASGENLTYYNVGVIDSCDYFGDGSRLAAIKNLPGAEGFELVTIDVATGAQTLLLTVKDEGLDLDEVEVARDGQSFLLSWTDRRDSTAVPLISEWRAGETLLEGTVIAYEASQGSYICDFNSNNLPDDGYVYRSSAGRHPTWIEQVDGEPKVLIEKMKGDVYRLKPAC